MHPNKHIREAMKYAEEHGWRIVPSHAAMRSGRTCSADVDIVTAKCPIWSTPQNPENFMRGQFAERSMRVRECTSMTPECLQFYLMLRRPTISTMN